MWRAYWGNLGPSKASRLPVRQHLALLDRAVVSVLDFRCSRWPPLRQICRELDCLQRKMTSIFLRTPRLPGEAVDAYCRRRGRIAGACCRQQGLWSKRWCQRVLSWNMHLERDRNHLTWPAQTLLFRGLMWLQHCRANLLTNSATSGRTDTRSKAGCVHARWHNGVEFAKQMCK